MDMLFHLTVRKELSMRYNFFYDESEHSRKINHNTVTASNFGVYFVCSIIRDYKFIKGGDINYANLNYCPSNNGIYFLMLILYLN